MGNTNILFWIVAVPTLFLLFSAVQAERATARGWLFKSVVILIVLMCSAQMHNQKLIYLAAALWVIFVLLPNFLEAQYNKRIIEQQFGAALRVARAIAVLHPFDGWREQPRIVRALELAKQGETDAALKILDEFRNVTSPTAITAMVNFYRIAHRWEEFSAWSKQQSFDLESDPTFLSTMLRVRGEIGDVRGVVELYQKNLPAIERMPPSHSDFCRLVLFAFAGRRDLVERLFETSLATLPEQTKKFWATTGDLTAGKVEVAGKDFEAQLQTAEPWNRRAIERRLSKALPTADSLDPAHRHVIEDAAREHGYEQMFDVSPPMREAQATRILILLNIAMFFFEIYKGGSTNSAVLIGLGAVQADLVHAGQWWRLWAALFLHWGFLHIAMNMFNLSIIGPFVEGAFGYGKFVFLYAVAGVGSMFVVITLSRHGYPTVGASGAIMGLVGATGALMLKGWLHHRAHPAKRKLRAIISIVAIQTVFDALIPQVSMTAHLSGALIGFATALVLSNRLTK